MTDVEAIHKCQNKEEFIALRLASRLLALLTENQIKITNLKSLFKVFLISLISTLLITFSFTLIARSLGCYIDPRQTFNVQLGLLANYIPLSFSGWGFREVALLSLLRNGTHCEESAILMASII